MSKLLMFLFFILIVIGIVRCTQQEECVQEECDPCQDCPGCPQCPTPETIIKKVPIYETVTETVYVNNTIYNGSCANAIEKTIFIHKGNSTIITTLIKRLEFYESREEMYLNYTDCSYLEVQYDNCSNTLEDIKLALD